MCPLCGERKWKMKLSNEEGVNRLTHGHIGALVTFLSTYSKDLMENALLHVKRKERQVSLTRQMKEKRVKKQKALNKRWSIVVDKTE